MTTGSRPVTLFTGQWADLPFEEVAGLAAEWGYDGLEIAASGDHLDLERADEDDAYARSRLRSSTGTGSRSTRSRTTSRGGRSATTRSTSATRRSSATTCGATVNSSAEVSRRAAPRSRCRRWAWPR